MHIRGFFMPAMTIQLYIKCGVEKKIAFCSSSHVSQSASHQLTHLQCNRFAPVLLCMCRSPSVCIRFICRQQIEIQFIHSFIYSAEGADVIDKRYIQLPLFWYKLTVKSLNFAVNLFCDSPIAFNDDM